MQGSEALQCWIFIRSRWQMHEGVNLKFILTDFEEKLGLSRGSSLSVHHLDIGRIAFPICMDATYFETFYAAAEQGAELIILPIANMEEYSLPRAHTRNMGQGSGVICVRN